MRISSAVKDMPDANCPKCSRVLSRAVCADAPGVKPGPGDFTNCIYCGALLEFAEDLSLIFATDETLKKMAGSLSFKLTNMITNHMVQDQAKRSKRVSKGRLSREAKASRRMARSKKA